MNTLDQGRIATFRTIVYDYYAHHGRSLPWRETTDPYHILVSEIMLQQTQVARVTAKFPAFLEQFPGIADLAASQLQDVLAAWQGLGYNRRARLLREAAEQILASHGGRVPEDEPSLAALPGIGTATARAIQAYAFNKPVVFIETNIRAVYIHHFFPDREKVSDRELEPMVEVTLDRENPRRWYNALMDYGVHLKKILANPARASSHHTRQAPFEGSLRQVRGAVLRCLVEDGPIQDKELYRTLPFSTARVDEALKGLERDQLVSRTDQGLAISRGGDKEQRLSRGPVVDKEQKGEGNRRT